MPEPTAYIPFTLPDYEARNSRIWLCCCPERACYKGDIENDIRVVRRCRPGFDPNFKVYHDGTTPSTEFDGAFDKRVAGVLEPQYKHSKVEVLDTATATIAIRAKHYTDGESDGTYSFDVRYSLTRTNTVEAEYGKPMEDWPASNLPAGPCPDRSLLFPSGTPSPSFTLLAPGDEGGVTLPNVAVKFQWLDVRNDDPDDAPPPGVPPAKLGYYEVSLNGGSSLYANGSDGISDIRVFSSLDHAEHTFRARQVVDGSYGQWSSPITFSVASPACAPFDGDCSNFLSAGNLQHTPDAATEAAAESWTSTNSESDPATQTGGNSCVSSSPTNVPSEITLPNVGDILTAARNPLSPSSTTTTTKTPSVETVTFTGSGGSGPDPDHDDEPGDPPADPPPETDPTPPEGETLSGWYVTLDHQVASVTTKTTTTYSDDQNAGDTTLTAMLSDAATVAAGWSAEWAWGYGSNYITVGLSTSDLNVSHGLRCFGGFPITDGFTIAGGPLRCSYPQMRYRWEVPYSFTGDSYRTRWSVARFDDRWMIWRERYIRWAEKKREFLLKPAPGDPDYPVLSDFFDDPETPEDEAQNALDDAVAALDAITDPGDAPAEPEDLRPAVVSNHEWTWLREEATSRPIPVLDFCDPTRPTREAANPEMRPAPDRDDYPEGTEGDEAYADAVAEIAAAVAAWEARSKRLSDWYVINPDRVSEAMQPSDYDAAEPLPSNPSHQNPDGSWKPGGENAFNIAHKAWELQTAAAAWRNARFVDHERIHESYRICDVRFSCGANPSGDLAEEWDASFPTTSLPVVDADTPNTWDWEQWRIWYRAGGTGVPEWYITSAKIII